MHMECIRLRLGILKSMEISLWNLPTACLFPRDNDGRRGLMAGRAPPALPSKHSLPTEDIRAHRHMADNSSCGLCGAPYSWRHSLINSTAARWIRALVDDDLAQQLVATSEPSAKQWLFGLMDSLPHNLFVLLSVTQWAIWSARCNVIHEGIFQTPQATHAFIKRFIDELDMIKEPQRVSVQRVPMTGQAGRPPRAPPLGFAKIHVDAGARNG